MDISRLIPSSDWIIWIVFAFIFGVSLVLISGRGSFLVMSKKTYYKKRRPMYDKEKSCRVIGSGTMFIAIIILFIAIFKNNISERFAYVAILLILVDYLITKIICKKTCKKTKYNLNISNLEK